MIYNLREASKHGIPAPRDGYEQRKVVYKKYNEAVIKGWSKRIDDGVEYTDKDFILCERRIVVELDDNNTFLATTPNVPEAVGVGDTAEEAVADLEVAVEIVDDVKAMANIIMKAAEEFMDNPSSHPEILVAGISGNSLPKKNRTKK